MLGDSHLLRHWHEEGFIAGPDMHRWLRRATWPRHLVAEVEWLVRQEGAWAVRRENVGAELNRSVQSGLTYFKLGLVVFSMLLPSKELLRVQLGLLPWQGAGIRCLWPLA